MVSIYCITNTVTNDRYVGSARNFLGRKRVHLTHLRNNKHHSIFLQRSWNKYGETNFTFQILQRVRGPNNLVKTEQWWLDSIQCNYNMCKIAGSVLGMQHSKASRKKMSIAKTGRKMPLRSEEFKKKMSIIRNRYFQVNGFPRPKQVLQYSLENILIKEWASSEEAAKAFGINKSNIIKTIGGKRNTSCGFKWKYKNDNNVTEREKQSEEEESTDSTVVFKS